MWIKDVDGDFVNIETGSVIKHSYGGAVVFTSKSQHKEKTILFTGLDEECEKYMTELEKELAAFGKLVRVEMEN